MAAESDLPPLPRLIGLLAAGQEERIKEYATAARAPLLARIAELEGIRPELPPRPPSGQGLPRYGLRWNGPTEPLAVPFDDGYWTPWHLAEALRAELERQVAANAAMRADSEIGKIIWRYIDRMCDLDFATDPATQILADFVAAVRPAIDAAIDAARAAHSAGEDSKS